MSGIFISYRREDSAEDAHRLYRRLCERFGADSVFMDLEDIDVGDNFADVIEEKVGFCDALVAVVGRRWLDCEDGHGRRRLDDPLDWVRLEIALALSRGVKVFPVLVGGAAPPFARDLPSALSALAQRQAMPLRSDRFDEDVARLGDALALAQRPQGVASLWFSIIARGHRALDPLDLQKPAVLWQALGFLVLMSAVDAAIRWPTAPDLYFPLKFIVAECVQNLGVALILHLAMRAVGGVATLQRSVATLCFLTAWMPLIGLAQFPVWNLTAAIDKQAMNNTISAGRLLEEMSSFVATLGVSGVIRVLFAFVAGTWLWWRFFKSVFGAFRALHHLSTRRALAGLAIAIPTVAAFAVLVVSPYFGAVY